MHLGLIHRLIYNNKRIYIYYKYINPWSYWFIDVCKKKFRQTNRHLGKRFLGPISINTINGENDESGDLKEKNVKNSGTNVIGEEISVNNYKKAA